MSNPPHDPQGRRLLVIGAGAAGVFCAVNAARMLPGLHVTILEKSIKPLAKVKVSGGGRCNVTHDCPDPEELILKYPRGKHFLRKAFHHFSCPDTVNWFQERGVGIKTEADGRMFPATNDSQTIIDCLFRELNKYHVDLVLQADVTDVERHESPEGTRFVVSGADGRQWTAEDLMLATGGLPRSGAPAWLLRMGHTIVAPAPSLFTFNLPKHPITELMGISLPAEVSIRALKLKERGPLLITHWGLSGPVVLKLSAWGARDLQELNYRFDVTVNFLPGRHETGLLEEIRNLRGGDGAKTLLAHNPFGLPARLWAFLLEGCGIGAQERWNMLTNEKANRLAAAICGYVFHADGKTTFKEEFVTAGGVALKEVDPHHFQSRKVPHLYFAGEVLDIDGITGGFNFQNAWTGGWLAARSIAGMY